MKLRDLKIAICILFMGIFMTKMAISVAPVFIDLNNKTVNAVITQLEQETKAEKESPEKDILKEKKIFDEIMIYHEDFKVLVFETNVLHNKEKALFKQVYHPVVPTPPPTFNIYFPGTTVSEILYCI